MCLDDLRPPNDKAFRQPGAQRLAEIGHLVKIGDPAVIDPVKQLL